MTDNRKNGISCHIASMVRQLSFVQISSGWAYKSMLSSFAQDLRLLPSQTPIRDPLYGYTFFLYNHPRPPLLIFPMIVV